MGDLGGIVHGLAVPISYQQAHPLWTNIPSGHATGNLTIKVRHLPQSEHLAVGSEPGTYNLASWSVETGENEKEMKKKRLKKVGGYRELINMIEAQGDIPAWLRKSPYTGASHIYFSQPPYTTELDRKKGYPLYDKVYTEKTKIQKTIRAYIQKLIEVDDKFQKEKRDKVAEKHYNDAQEIIDHIEMLILDLTNFVCSYCNLKDRKNFHHVSANQGVNWPGKSSLPFTAKKNLKREQSIMTQMMKCY